MLNSQPSKDVRKSPSVFSAAGQDNGAPLVLVVEDDADSRFMLRYLLEMWKYRVVEAKNGAEAFSLAESSSPDLILMDVSLPDTDGFAVARRVRGCADLVDVPVVFLSGYARKDFDGETSDVEITDYFVKPIGADDLKNTIGKYCGAARQKAA